jgi:hypothetical protein
MKAMHTPSEGWKAETIDWRDLYARSKKRRFA